MDFKKVARMICIGAVIAIATQSANAKQPEPDKAQQRLNAEAVCSITHDPKSETAEWQKCVDAIMNELSKEKV